MAGGSLGRPMMVLAVEVDAPMDLGVVDGHSRRCIPIIGGTVTGDYRGHVLPGGADWQTIAPNGSLEISARYAIELEQGVVEIRSDGVRHASPEILARLAAGEILRASEYYFRTAIRFRSASPALIHLNTMLAIAVGERLPTQVRLSVHPVL